MIVRTWSARADTAGARDYAAYFSETLQPELRKLAGFNGAYLLSRDVDGEIELTAHTFWESLDTIRDFTGADIGVSIVEPAAQAMLTSYDRTATHRSVRFSSF